MSWKQRRLEKEAEEKARVEAETKVRQSIGKAIRARQLTLGVDRTEVEVLPQIEEGQSPVPSSTSSTSLTPYATPSSGSPSTTSKPGIPESTTRTPGTHVKNARIKKSGAEDPIKKLNFDTLDDTPEGRMPTGAKAPRKSSDKTPSTKNQRKSAEIHPPKPTYEQLEILVQEYLERTSSLQKLYQAELQKQESEKKSLQENSLEMEKERNDLLEMMQM